jgi:hypothetical protein
MKKAKSRTETLTIRPSAQYKGIVKKLNALAKADNRSLNNYVLILFDGHIKAKENAPA